MVAIEASFQELRGESEGVGVDEGLAAGDLHKPATEVLYLPEDPFEGDLFPTVEGILGVTPDAAKGASGKPNEGAGEPGPGGLPLNTRENLRHLQ